MIARIGEAKPRTDGRHEPVVRCADHIIAGQIADKGVVAAKAAPHFRPQSHIFPHEDLRKHAGLKGKAHIADRGAHIILVAPRLEVEGAAEAQALAIPDNPDRAVLVRRAIGQQIAFPPNPDERQGRQAKLVRARKGGAQLHAETDQKQQVRLVGGRFFLLREGGLGQQQASRQRRQLARRAARYGLHRYHVFPPG